MLHHVDMSSTMFKLGSIISISLKPQTISMWGYSPSPPERSEAEGRIHSTNRLSFVSKAVTKAFHIKMTKRAYHSDLYFVHVFMPVHVVIKITFILF